MIKSNPCKLCQSVWHTKAFCPLNRKPIKASKRPNKQSAKELDYQEWKEAVARPYVIERDGAKCNCCNREVANLDLDHILSKGSRPDLKRDLENLQLLCRYPCHFNKTNELSCSHP